jgi:hypothetical protein
MSEILVLASSYPSQPSAGLDFLAKAEGIRAMHFPNDVQTRPIIQQAASNSCRYQVLEQASSAGKFSDATQQ